MRKAVILAGGTGTRLWPLSREERPKQFLAFDDRGTLLQQAYRRLQLCLPDAGIYVCTLERYANLTREQLPALAESQLILEPCGRGTGPCSAYVAAWLRQRFGDAVVATVAADSWIADAPAFATAMNSALAVIEESPSAVAAIGIRPTRPETGFGYLEVEEGLHAGAAPLRVRRFVEKPDRLTAEGYVGSGRYLWNGSFFVWRCGRLLELFGQHQPEVAARITAMEAAGLGDRPGAVEREIYEEMPRGSVDRAVMERARPMFVVPADMGWNDLGSWERVADCCGATDPHGVRHISIRDGRVLVRGGTRLVATLGLDNVAVVDTADALLVCNLQESESLKEVMDEVRARGCDDLV